MQKNSGSRMRLFIESFVVYGIGSGLSKLVPLVMLPILTRLYPSSLYIGLNDNTQTIANLVSNVMILGLYDIMYRFFFDSKELEYQKKVTSTALISVSISAFSVLALLFIFRNQISQLFFSSETYGNLVILGTSTAFMMAINMIVAAPTRMQNRKTLYLAVNIFSSVLIYSIALPIVLSGNYIYALPLSMLVSYVCSTIIFFIINRKFFNYKGFDFSLCKKMIVLGVPLMPSFIFYWLINSAQKVFVTQMVGLEAVGVYSVGSKMSQISQLVYSAFAFGWQYFTFHTMRDKDHTVLISRIHELLTAVMVITSCVMVIISKPLFNLLFEHEYYEASYIMPLLFTAPLIQMLFQCAGSQFLVYKQSKQSLICLVIGGAVAISLDFVLIPLLGIRGAPIARICGLMCAWIFILVWLIKKKYITFSRRCYCITFLMLLSSIALVLKFHPAIYIGLAVIAILLTVILFKKDAVDGIKAIFKQKSSNKSSDTDVPSEQ